MARTKTNHESTGMNIYASLFCGETKPLSEPEADELRRMEREIAERMAKEAEAAGDEEAAKRFRKIAES